MKSFLKKMNRGVALGIVLLVVMMGFFVVDAVTFSKGEAALKDFLEEYLDACAEINLLPEQYREPGADIPDGIIGEKTKEAKDFVEKYFAEYKRPGYIYNSTKESMLANAEYVYKANKDRGSVVRDINYSLVSISNIQKQATNAVKISFKVNVTVTASQEATYLNLGSMQTHDVDLRHGGVRTDREITTESWDADFSFTLFKINDKWKIGLSEGGYKKGMSGSYAYVM